MSSRVTPSGSIDGTLSLMPLAASSDSNTTIARPVPSLYVQCPATNPGACDTPGTTFSFKWLSADSRSAIVTLATTACIGASFVAGFVKGTLSANQAQALQTFMGRANISITLDRYGHLMPGSQEQGAEPLDRSDRYFRLYSHG